MISFVRAPEETFSAGVLDALGSKAGRLFPGRNDPLASRLAPPGPTSPTRRAPPRLEPPVVYPGF